MRTFIKFLIGSCTMATTILATAAPSISDLAVPRFRKGIWATKHYQEVAGSPSRQDPENILDECVAPAESIRRGLLSGEKGGCELKMEDSEIPHRFVYLSSCPGGTVRLIVETANPTEYKITTTFPQARHVQIGHWVRDCPGVSNQPLRYDLSASQIWLQMSDRKGSITSYRETP